MTPATKGQVALIRKLRLGAFVLGLILFAAGAVLLVRACFFISTTIATTATVTANESSRGERGTRFHSPTFRFTDQNGEEQTVKFRHSSTEYGYNVGADVDIRYDPDNPQTIRVANFFGIWGVAVIVTGLGLVMFLASLLFGYTATAFIEQQMKRQQNARGQAS